MLVMGCGVVPRSLALEIVERNSCNFKRYKDWVKRINGRAMKPKLIFNFQNVNES